MNFSRKAGAVLLALSLVALTGACGNDDSSDTAGDADAGGSNGFTISITAEGISMPDEVVGGIVEVTLDTELEDATPNFTRVTTGTTEEDFRKAAAGVVSGQPFPAFFESNSGLEVERSTITLPEGDYFAWTIPDDPEEGDEAEGAPDAEGAEAEGPPEGEGEGEGPGGPPPEAVVLKAFKVTAGEAGDLPELEDTITARDYSFDVKITGGADEIVFRNEGPEQWHHAEIFDFGDLDQKEVEANFPAFLEAGPDTPPPAIFKDVDFDKLEAGSSAVFSPGLGGTTEVKIESGKTYAIACFISDLTGGPPHAFSKGMINVFQAS